MKRPHVATFEPTARAVFSASGTGALGTPEYYLLDPAISPDGRRVAVSIGPAGRNDIWVFDLSGGGASESAWSLSRDGRYMAIVRTAADRQSTIWVLPRFGDRTAVRGKRSGEGETACAPERRERTRGVALFPLQSLTPSPVLT